MYENIWKTRKASIKSNNDFQNIRSLQIWPRICQRQKYSRAWFYMTIVEQFENKIDRIPKKQNLFGNQNVVKARPQDTGVLLFIIFERRESMHFETWSICSNVKKEWGAKHSTLSLSLSLTSLQSFFCVVYHFSNFWQIQFFSFWKRFVNQSNYSGPRNDSIRRGGACIWDSRRL